jgi:hypothetical protein
LVGDANLNGEVELQDFSALKANFGTGTTWFEGDFNLDGAIDLQDFSALKANFGASVSPAVGAAALPTPEPATLALVALGGAAVLLRRRGQKQRRNSMHKRIVGLVLVLGLGLVVGAGQASAALIANADLTLYVNPGTGDAYLKNMTGSPLDFDAYSIASAGGNLSVAGWDSISDQVIANPGAMIAKLGAGCLQFGEASPTSSKLTELNSSNAATLSGNDTLTMGTPVVIPGGGLPVSDLSFQWTSPTVGEGNAYVGDVVLVPEPATLALVALGGLAMILRRRRAA